MHGSWYTGSMNLRTLSGIQLTAAIPSSWEPWTEWLKLGAPILAALVVAILSYRLNRRLASLNADLTSKIQAKLDSDRAQRTEQLELLKLEIHDILASRARRADYLKSQITNLYGPLVFSLEHCRICMQRAIKFREAILGAVDADNSSSPPNTQSHPGLLDAANTHTRYIEAATESNEEAIKILRSGWQWLDEDDRELAINFVQEIEYYKFEFKERNNTGLAEHLYDPQTLPSKALTRINMYHETFIAQMSDRLNLKQRELSGLIATTGQPSSK
jgi:hypothetical protein